MIKMLPEDSGGVAPSATDGLVVPSATDMSCLAGFKFATHNTFLLPSNSTLAEAEDRIRQVPIFSHIPHALPDTAQHNPRNAPEEVGHSNHSAQETARKTATETSTEPFTDTDSTTIQDS